MRTLLCGLLVTPLIAADWVGGRMGFQLDRAASELQIGDVIVAVSGVSIDSESRWKAACEKGGSGVQELEARRPQPGGGWSAVRATATIAGLSGRIGFFIETVPAASLAERSELRVGDFLFQINHERVSSPAVLDLVTRSYGESKRVEIHFHRFFEERQKWLSAVSSRLFRK